MYQYVLFALSPFMLNEQLKNMMMVKDEVIVKPSTTVSIIMCSYNEEKYIDKSLHSIITQDVYLLYKELFELIVIDGNSTDKTIEIARQYTNNIILQEKKGKLNARNIGTKKAMGNIIVSVDADREYIQGWLNSLLKPFNEPNIVAVNGSDIYSGEFPLHELGNYIELNVVHPHRLDGGNSAYYKNLFFNIGGFNEGINQQDVYQMIEEEEIGFGRKISKYGKIKYILNANSLHMGTNKFICRQQTETESCKIQKFGIDRF